MSAAAGQSVTSQPFGTTPQGEGVDLYTLANAGILAEVLTYGGIVKRVLVPDRRGHLANVTLGFSTLEDYVERNDPHFGALIGRYANRIAGGTFELDGATYTVPQNDGPNALHGGTIGFDRHVWNAAPLAAAAGAVGLRLERTSPDGEMGFPGALSVELDVTLAADGSLRFDYRAVTDSPTALNLTNHSYWNLAGEGSGTILDHVLTLPASSYTPVGPSLVPTGELASVDGTPLDFRRPTPLGARIRDGFEQLLLARGYDHNLVLERGRAGRPLHAAHVHDPASGRTLDVLTDQPGIQLYSGNSLDGTLVGPGGNAYRQSDGFALETQHFPDSPNQPTFPSTVLRPGETFTSTTTYRFGTAPR